MRFKIVRLVFAFFLAGLIMQLFTMQIISGNYYRKVSRNNSIRVVPLEGPRGRILDRNGVILTENRHSYNVAVIPQEIDDKDVLFNFLSRALQIESKKLLQKFWERKIAPFAPVVVAEDVSKEDAMTIEENKFLYPGLSIQESFVRYYPFRDVGAHVLGYVGRIDRAEIEQMKDYGYSPQSMIGKNGIEDFYDSYLQGRQGGLQIEVNSRGRQVTLLGLRDAQIGKDIQLTIDQRVQQAVYDAIDGRKGAVVIMNLDSGEILGLVSSPAYDPNVFVSANLRSQASRYLFSNTDAPLLNRVIKGQYPPGSIFKIVVSVAGFVSGQLTPNTSFNCDGAYHLGRALFRCAHVHGLQNFWQAITHSCNVYFFNAGLKIGPYLLEKSARLLGLGSKTDIDLPFEEKGLVPGRMQRKVARNQGWFKGDTLNMAIGQGEVLVTPIQLLRLIATVARDGREPQLYLLKSIGSQEMVKFATVRSIPLKQGTLETVKKALSMVVHEPTGTANILDMPDIDLAGKTGTAQSVAGKDSHAWFAGYSTNGKIRIGICVFLEYGGSSYNACVMAKEIISRMKQEGII